MQRSKRSGRFSVTDDGKGLTGRSGTAAVRELADRVGLTERLVHRTVAGRRHRKQRSALDDGQVSRLSDLRVAPRDGQ